jgi:hypothetical protein
MLDVSLDRTCLARSIIDSLPEPAKGVHAKVTLKKGGARSRCVFHIGGGSSQRGSAPSHEIKRSYMKRFVILGLTVVLTVGIIAAALAFAVPKSSAAIDLSARGPSVGVDDDNNQFVFWKGTNNQLEEAFYTAATNTWSSTAIDLRSVGFNMNSAPSVAVQNLGGGFLSGGQRYGAQFVFWRGTTNDLWYAYWAGSWQGAFEVPGVTNVASTPSAAFNNIRGSWGPGYSEISIFWQGTDGFLWYIRLTNPLGGVDGISGSPQFVGPHQATFFGESLGTLGSPPGASNTSIAGFTAGGGVNGQGAVTWKGATNSNLWYVPYSISLKTGDLTITNIAQKVSKWDINGGPSAVEEYFTTQQTSGLLFDLAWQDNNHDIEYASSDLSTYFQGSNALGAYPAASAPSIGYWQGNSLTDTRIYIFYKGQDGYLHEEYYNQTQQKWHAYSYPQYGTLG